MTTPSYGSDITNSDPGARTPRQQYLARLRRLEEEARNFLMDWEEIGDHFLPGSVRRRASDRIKSPISNPDIVNGIGILAQRVLSSGMMSWMTNPARPWLALGVPDEDLMKFWPVKEWCHTVSTVMFNRFAATNLYQVLPVMYSHMAAHGTAVAVQEEDPKTLFRFYHWTTGSYFLANSARLEVDTGYRRLTMTVRQMYDSFGPDKISGRVRRMYEKRQFDDYIDVCRVIEPNYTQDAQKIDYAGMPIKSCWFEHGGDTQGLLRESGFRTNPLLAPRWDVIGEDVYGRGLGHYSLPDSRMLQTYGRREGQIVDGIAGPAIAAPAALAGAYPQPGEMVRVPFSGTQNTAAPIYAPRSDAVSVLDTRQQRLEKRIGEWWFYDLWMMLEQDNRQQPVTAREIAERHEEKIIQIGPVLVRIYNELLDRLVARSFDIMLRLSIPFWVRGENGILPMPPQELQGMQMRVEYISPLALAHKLVGITADERLASFVGGIAPLREEVMDKINWDRLIEGYAERVSADPDIIVPQDVVDKRRAARAQAASDQQVATERLPGLAKAAQQLSQTDVNGDSALNRLLAARGAPGVGP